MSDEYEADAAGALGCVAAASLIMLGTVAAIVAAVVLWWVGR